MVLVVDSGLVVRYLGLQMVGVLVVEPHIAVVGVGHAVGGHPVLLVTPPSGYEASHHGRRTKVKLQPLTVWKKGEICIKIGQIIAKNYISTRKLEFLKNLKKLGFFYLDMYGLSSKKCSIFIFKCSIFSSKVHFSSTNSQRKVTKSQREVSEKSAKINFGDW